jgi:DNA-binding protein HU-beta
VPAKFVLSKARGGKFRFELLASNGKVLAQSVAHDTKRAAVSALRSVQKNAVTDVVDDQTEPAKKATATKATATKTAAKKTAGRKTAVRTATAKRAAVKSSPAVKSAATMSATTAKKAAARRTTVRKTTTAPKRVPATPATQA